jgi:hypothetical protein
MASTPMRARRRALPAAFASLLIALLAAFGLLIAGRGAASAQIVCSPSSPDGNASALLRMAYDWRIQYVPGIDPGDMPKLSAPLNAAAAGYARYLVDHPTATGHNADGSSPAERAIQCGYPTELANGDEAIALARGAAASTYTTDDALKAMVFESYYGRLRIPPVMLNGQFVRCAGVGSATSEKGDAVAYVILLFAGSGPTCSQSVSVTKLTPTPKPGGIHVAGGWNFVTLPGGQFDQLLGPAFGCYKAIYNWDGKKWRRYIPGLPDYVQDMTGSDGGAFWIEGVGRGCTGPGV